MRSKCLLLVILALTCTVGSVAAQTPARNPADRLREVLPADVAERVLVTIAAARARELPAVALEQRALKFAAKGVDPLLIEKSVAEHAERMLTARTALERARSRKAAIDELEAGADALRKGVRGEALSELARAAASGRSLALPLYTLGELIDRGLPADEAIRRVYERLTARAADSDFQRMTTEQPNAQGNRPELTGPDLAETKRPPNASAAGRGKPPATIPSNAGKDTRPGRGRATTPPGRGRGGA